MKNLILAIFFIPMFGSSALGGHDGGVARVVNTFESLQLGSGSVFNEIISNSNISAEELIEGSANVISTFRSGVEYNFDVDWDNQIVDFEDSSATFDEVVIEADQIIIESEDSE